MHISIAWRADDEDIGRNFPLTFFAKYTQQNAQDNKEMMRNVRFNNNNNNNTMRVSRFA
jgi:hypothetical protein